jgi:hypothetical protein
VRNSSRPHVHVHVAVAVNDDVNAHVNDSRVAMKIARRAAGTLRVRHGRTELRTTYKICASCSCFARHAHLMTRFARFKWQQVRNIEFAPLPLDGERVDEESAVAIELPFSARFFDDFCTAPPARRGDVYDEK